MNNTDAKELLNTISYGFLHSNGLISQLVNFWLHWMNGSTGFRYSWRKMAVAEIRQS